MNLTLPIVERFWNKVDRSAGPDACWPWTAGKYDARGYGAFCIQRRNVGAHRVAYTLAHGEIPAGMGVLHRCDNPSCCNSRHLFLGTNTDNVADMVAKGRHAQGDSNGARLHPDRLARGERHGSAKLTHAQADTIRDLLAAGHTKKGTARQFGVSDRTIRRIATGETWQPAILAAAALGGDA